jgi:hypothetical protein
MQHFFEKIQNKLHIQNTNKSLGLLTVVLLLITIPFTLSLQQEERDIRQQAATNQAIISVNPTMASPGAMLKVQWTVGATAATPAGIITASPNPCTLGANGLCTSTITIQAKPSNSLQIKIRETGTAFTGVGTHPRSSYPAPWITATGYTFDLYEGNTLMGSVVVNGVSTAVTPTTSSPMIATPSATAFVTQAQAPTPTPLEPASTLTGAETLQLYQLSASASATQNSAIAVGQRVYLNCQPVTLPTPTATSAAVTTITTTPAVTITPLPTATSTATTVPSAPVFSGACEYQIPPTATPGTYIMRMVAADNKTILGESPLIFVNTHMISASPNPCLLNAQGLCSSTISWKTEGVTTVEVKIQEFPGILFAGGTSGSQLASWISAAGYTFEMYGDGRLIGSVFVKGVQQNAATDTSCMSDADCRSGMQCQRYQNYPGICRAADTVCTAVITRACRERATCTTEGACSDVAAECVDFPNPCVIPSGWSVQSQARSNENLSQ